TGSGVRRHVRCTGRPAARDPGAPGFDRAAVHPRDSGPHESRPRTQPYAAGRALRPAHGRRRRVSPRGDVPDPAACGPDPEAAPGLSNGESADPGFRGRAVKGAVMMEKSGNMNAILAGVFALAGLTCSSDAAGPIDPAVVAAVEISEMQGVLEVGESARFHA